MDSEELSKRFCEFCGRERYMKFLKDLNLSCPDKGRLLFWQEDLWTRFRESIEDAEIPTSYEEIAKALRLCHVHLCPFEIGEQTRFHIPRGLILDFDLDSPYQHAFQTLFPLANTETFFVNSDMPRGYKDTETTIYCPECRRAEEEWYAQHGRIDWSNIVHESHPEHHKAFRLAEQARIAKRRRSPLKAQRLLREALEYERRAAESIAHDLTLEPLRSTWHQSAASLAIECGELREAERLIAVALSGNPPEEIAEELRALLQQIYLSLRKTPVGAA